MSTLAASLAKSRGALVLGAALGLLTAQAAAAAPVCLRWDASGVWTAIQDNGTHAEFTVTQGDAQIQGNASYAQGYYTGNFDGTLSGSDMKFTVYWQAPPNRNGRYESNSIGEYSGTISPTGRVTGTTFDKSNPQTHANWYSSRQMACSRWSVPKPTVTLGRAPPTAGSGAPMSICDRARDAVARNAPTAPALERQCKATGG
jgi:hypothetical protein